MSSVAVLLWYVHCPLSPGPPMWIRSSNRDMLESDNWNWGFTYKSLPSGTATPSTLVELIDVVKSAGTLRVVGGGHSFAPLAATSGVLVDLALLDGIVVSSDKATVTVGAGAKIRAVQHALLKHNRVVHGFGGGTHHQSMAGALSTNLHGAQNCLFADAVTEMRLINASGGDVKAVRGDEMFNAVISGMGMLGVVHEVTLVTYARKCLRTTSTKVGVDEGHDALYGADNKAAEYKTTGYGVGLDDGVLTVYTDADIVCEVDYPASDYRDLTAAYTFDNWIAPTQVLLWPLVGSTQLFHDTLTGVYMAKDGEVVGVENGWRGEPAPLFGEVFTEYSVPRPACTAALREIRSAADRAGIVITAMTIKPLPADTSTLLAYASVVSCALEIYYTPCQSGLREHLLAVQAIVFNFDGGAHLGKVYFEDVRLNYHRKDMGNVGVFETLRQNVDPGGKFGMAAFAYDVDYTEMHTRAVFFRVAVALAFAVGVVGVVSGCVDVWRGCTPASKPGYAAIPRSSPP